MDLEFANFGKCFYKKLVKITVIFLTVILLIVCFVFGPFSDIVLADEPLSNCSSAEIYGDGVSNIIEIKLNCSNVSTFVSSGAESADSLDLSKIKLHPNNNPVSPISATIDSLNSQLLLRYLNSDQTYDSSILIQAGTIFNQVGTPNDQILIASDDVADYSPPHVTDDSYLYYLGEKLIIPYGTDYGVLDNDKDYESQNLTAFIKDSPLYGSVTLNIDGSFTYIPPIYYVFEDYFTYYVYDESGNQNQATVTIKYAETIVKATIRSNNINPNFAKVGDKITVEVNANAPILYDQDDVATIGAGDVVYIEIDSKNFLIEYILTEDDEEGEINYFINYYDSIGGNKFGDQKSVYNVEDGIVFDKTAPIVELNDDSYLELEIYDIYEEQATAFDSQDDSIELIINGAVDATKIGVYYLSYSAIDKSGNVATTEYRTVKVFDSVNEEFILFAEQLRTLGINSNIGEVGVDNVGEFYGLYIEKVVEDLPLIRITYNKPVNMEDGDFTNFLLEIFDRLIFVDYTNVSLDFGDYYQELYFVDFDVNIKLFGIDKIGINKTYSSDDVYNRIILSNNSIDKASIFLSNGRISSCSYLYKGCYAYDIDMQYFTDFMIDNFPPKITLDKVVDRKADGFLEVYVTIDNSVNSMALYINNRLSFYLDIKSGLQQIYQIKYSDLKYGKNFFKIIAADLFGNQSIVEFDLVNVPAKNIEPIYYQTNVAIDNVDEELPADDNNGKTLNQKDEVEVVDSKQDQKKTSENGILSWYWGMIIVSASGLIVWWIIEGARFNRHQ